MKAAITSINPDIKKEKKKKEKKKKEWGS